jgi:triosephosphate isomerase
MQLNKKEITTMRKPIIVGNWKMFTILAEARELVKTLKENIGEKTEIEVGVCPPFVYLASVKNVIEGSNIKLGAQNCHWEKSGAFTGEVAALMLKDVGCSYVIVGHSERRHQMGESDEVVNRKLKAVLGAGLTPIFCLGELLEEREGGSTETVLRRQITQGLNSITPEQMENVIIAYEPVWAIGTGKTATPQQAQETHSFIRKFISTTFTEAIAQDIRIMYGGSVKPENSAQLSAQPDIDGFLVGGASLKADSFSQIILKYKK